VTNTIFITGATGNIGGKIAASILKEDSTTRLVLLVRGNSDVEARRRIENVFSILSSEIDLLQMRKRVRVISGDITLSGLGIPEPLLSHLADEVTHIIHAAAATKFQLPLEHARLVNYVGTKNVMDFAGKAQRAGRLQRVAYISTAYVCGDERGTIYEGDVGNDQRFSNTYEQTKWESEQLVRNPMRGLPYTIFRPSIVVGDSQTGKTLAFNVLYAPLKYIYQGMLTALPCSPGTPLDVVPVDFVSNAIHHIFMRTELCTSKIYHIIAGSEKAATVGEIVDYAVEYFNSISPDGSLAGVTFLPANSDYEATTFFQSKGRRMLQLVKMYEPYIRVERSFDNTNTIEALKGTNISAPKLSSYYSTILKYCFATDWGGDMKYAA
jgi:thioester reductase-like protein